MVQLPDGQEWIFDMINNILIEVLASIAEQERITKNMRAAFNGLLSFLYMGVSLHYLRKVF